MTSPAEEQVSPPKMTGADVLSRLRDPEYRPVQSVPLFIAPHQLLELHEELQREYAKASSDNIGMDSDAPDIGAKLAELEDELERDYQVVFKVGALPRRRWTDLLAAHPPTPQQRKAEQRLDFNPETFPAAAIQACLIEPALTAEQVDELENGNERGEGGLTDAQFNLLFNAVVSVNQSGLSAPKSVAAAAIRRMNAGS